MGDPSATFRRFRQGIYEQLRQYLRVPPHAILNVNVRGRPTDAEFNFETI